MMGKWRTWLSIFLIVFAIGFYTHLRDRWATDDASLAGGTRTAFVESAVQSCTQKTNSNPDTKGMYSAAVTNQYCNCYANAMADRLSTNKLKSFSAMDTSAIAAAMQPTMETASAQCQHTIPKEDQK